MILAELLPDLELDAATAPIAISGLAYDSRRVQPGYLFAAWAGSRADGHGFVPQALENGAAAILAERPCQTGTVPCVVVPNVRRHLAVAAKCFYGDPAAALRLVGVTGTNGKTTTVHLVESMLTAAGERSGMIGTLGSRFAGRTVEGVLTTPTSVDLLALLQTMVQAGVGAVAMEVSSQALDQERVDGLRFDVGVFTNLTHDHLDYHHSLDAYFAAKARLVRDLLKPHGRRVLNLDDVRVRTLLGPGALGFAVHDAVASVSAKSVRLDVAGLHLELLTPRGPLAVYSPLLGRFNVENVLATVTTGIALELTDASIVAGMAAVTHVPGRLERVSKPSEPLVLVDYAHTPDALAKALAALREVVTGRVFCVFGCGGDRDPHKRAPMGLVASKGSHWSIITNDNPRGEDPRDIARAIEMGFTQAGAPRSMQMTPGGYHIVLDRAQAIEAIIAAARPGDAVLIAGKGHETYQTIGTTQHAFDDREVARQCLAQTYNKE